MKPYATASELARLIASGEMTASEVVERHLERIAAINPELNAIVTLDEAGARARAREADAATARGDSLGPLHGVPFTLKDAHSTAGMRTTVGHESFADYVPEKNGTVAVRLRAAGAILLGKTNVPPLLMSAQTQNTIFGRTNNPHDRERTVGGSSGGAAAAVAAGLVAFEVGSDMSGSIRMPAHYCGIFGLKPTTNRLPTTGHIPPPPKVIRPDRHMGTVGPMARGVADLALVAEVLAGPDGIDLEVPPAPWRAVESRAPEQLKIAFLPSFPGVPTATEIRANVERVATALADQGAQVDERPPGFSLERLREVWDVFFPLFSGVFMDLSGTPLPVEADQDVDRSLLAWTRVLSGRDELIASLEELLTRYDAFLSPAGISEAFPHGPPRTPILVDGESVDSRYVDHYVFPFNLTGHPAIVIPAGSSRAGLPLGVQLVGRRWHDEELLAVAEAVHAVVDGYHPPANYAS